MSSSKQLFEKARNKESRIRFSKSLLISLVCLTMLLAYGFVACPQVSSDTCKTKAQPVNRQDELLSFPIENGVDVLTRRATERERYFVEQKTIQDFSFKKKIDYTPYLAAYIFAVEVDKTQNKISIISESGSLLFDPSEIDEIKRRVLFINDFESNMNNYYFLHSELQNSFNPHKFGFPEYENVPYVPFSSVNTADTHIYGFVNRPKRVKIIAGTNFIEDGPYGKQTNPQAVFLDYEFGPKWGSNSDERNKIRFNLLNEEFKKSKNESNDTNFVDRLRCINNACEIIGKSKSEITVLDLGCGLGRGLNMLRLDGYKRLYGLDMDSNKIGVLQKVCAENAIQEITTALLNMNSGNVVEKIHQELGQNVFDLVILHDTIEHIPDPHKTLRTIRSILADGGIVLFTGIPDEYSLAAQFGEATYGDYNKFTHLNFFTQNSIVSLANQEEFDVLFLYDDDTTVPSLGWSFINDECLPYVMNGKWFILGKALPDGITVRDLFPDNALAYNIYSCRPQDGQRMAVNFERFKLYEKHKKHINLLFKKFFLETTDTIFSPAILREKLAILKENLFNTLVLDAPTGIHDHDREWLEAIRDTESTHIKEVFQDAYQLPLRTRWCYFVRRS